jgi:hypothetical protein
VLEVVAAAADEVLGGRGFTERSGLATRRLGVVGEQGTARGQGGAGRRGGGEVGLRGRSEVAGLAELAAGTILARTVFTTGAIAFGALRTVFTTRTVAFGTAFAAGTVFTARTIALGAAFAAFGTLGTAFAARAVFAAGTIAFTALALGTTLAAVAAGTVAVTTLRASAFGALRTGAAVIAATLGASAFGALAVAVAVEDFIQLDGLQAKLRGHFLDDGLLKQIENGFEADGHEDGHEQRGSRQDQSKK